MKKIKYLTLLSLSLLALTSCFSSDVHGDIEREIRSADVVTDEDEKTRMIEIILDSKIGARNNNQHVLSVDVRVNAVIFNAGLAGYGYYNYNQDTDKSTFNLDVSGLSNLKIAIDEDQVMDANLKLANFDILNYEDVQLTFDAKPLNELVDFSLLGELDKSYIKEYRKSRYVDFDNIGSGYLAYAFTLDASKLNELLDSSVKFETDPVLSFLSERQSFETIDIVHLSGNVTFNNIRGGLKVFVYNVNPNN
jgi:hypothetical protein